MLKTTQNDSDEAKANEAETSEMDAYSEAYDKARASLKDQDDDFWGENGNLEFGYHG
jgi:hypothetical protein